MKQKINFNIITQLQYKTEKGDTKGNSTHDKKHCFLLFKSNKHIVL